MKQFIRLSLLSIAILGSAQGANITYYMNQTVGTGSAVGYITTDGTIGALSNVNVVDFNILVTSGSAQFDIFLDHNGLSTVYSSGTLTSGANFSATPTNLFFNYSGSDHGYLVFNLIYADGGLFIDREGALCFGTAGSNCFVSVSGSGVSAQIGVAPNDTKLPVDFSPASGNLVIASIVPEPATWALTGLALSLGLLVRRVTPRTQSAKP